MSTLGLILACDHYPAVSTRETMDAQLRLWLEAIGINAHQIEVFAAYNGELPLHAAGCDAWIFSGLPLPLTAPGTDVPTALRQFLRAAAPLGVKILAINHAEHMVHAAIGAPDAKPPETSSRILSIRNPFRSFHSRDTLHCFNRVTGAIEALPRPQAICRRRIFAAFRSAA